MGGSNRGGFGGPRGGFRGNNRGRGSHHFNNGRRPGAPTQEDTAKRPRPAGMQGWKQGDVLQGTIAEDIHEDMSMEGLGEGGFQNARRKSISHGDNRGRNSDDPGGSGRGLREERMLWDADDGSDGESMQIHDTWKTEASGKESRGKSAAKKQPRMEPRMELSVSGGSRLYLRDWNLAEENGMHGIMLVCARASKCFCACVCALVCAIRGMCVRVCLDCVYTNYLNNA